ncbi:MAG: hypothetical protein HON98_07025 [Chloroflexi bacterium]|jgi:hypothetical protein|nr:hypothetical protein [Chloroflexota bacterium]MBT3669696.1 hypothetical protein [Chloroflexota bacterium]MBT4002816.1 hypothetical protein [Chloroflexota bacterium]MBT4305650.1 hypothetical protein [Chloroflexota bacterium]MBT4533807.1 hypothetical protein [Chloroflexota bacterium]
MDEKPRQEFYSFSHQALPEVFFNDPQKFLTALNEHSYVFPRYIWGQMEKLANIGQDDSKEKDINVDISSHMDTSIYLITLPKPEYPIEAYFIALTSNPKNSENEQEHHFFTLEHEIKENGETSSVFCEWVDQDMHQKLIPGKEFSKEYFLDIIEEQLNIK